VAAPDRRLQLSRDAMRDLGYRVVDLLVEHLETLREKPVMPRYDVGPALTADFPEQGAPPDQVLREAEREILGRMMHVTHPRFFAFVPGPGNFVGAMAEALAAGFNVFAGTWLEGPGPAAAELATVDWLRGVCGFPETTRGLFVSGGSVANLTALAVARRFRLEDSVAGAVVYYSDQTHSAVPRALRVLGFATDQLQALPADESCRLPVAALARRVEQDRCAGRRPFCVIANAGTTNTGAVDPLEELAELCARQDLWLHVDGAYGAAAALSGRGRALLGGMERADSLALDPHKWLFQPFEMGCVLVRDGALLRDTFRILPEYLQDVHRRERFNFCDHGIQLSRSLRALKLWMSLRVFGVAAFREAIEWGFTLAEKAEARLRRNPLWEILTPAQMAIVSFRGRPPGVADAELDRWNQALVEAVLADGYTALTSTVLGGRTALRMCTINPRTTEGDIEDAIGRLESLAAHVG